jgi:hypothetical protein
MNDHRYEEIAPDQVLTVEEGVGIQQRIAALRGLKQWHWMGNYGSVYDPVAVANQGGLVAGEMILNFSGSLIAAWMFY